MKVLIPATVAAATWTTGWYLGLSITSAPSLMTVSLWIAVKLVSQKRM